MGQVSSAQGTINSDKHCPQRFLVQSAAQFVLASQKVGSVVREREELGQVYLWLLPPAFAADHHCNMTRCCTCVQLDCVCSSIF